MKKLYTLITLCACSIHSYSQVGVEIDTPQSTLHVKESRLKDNTNITTKADGILIPKLTKAELALKAVSAYQSSEHDGALIYVTEASPVFSGPSALKVVNINSPGFYFLNAQNFWEPISGLGFDKSNDAWVNNPAQSRIELGTNSIGETRTAGTEVIITDNGNFGINTLNLTKRFELNAANGENQTDYLKIENLASPPTNTVTQTLQIDGEGYVSKRNEENIEGKILRLPLALQNNISNTTPVTLKTEQNPLLSPNLTPNLINLIPGYYRDSSLSEFTLPPGLYKYEVRLIGYFDKEDSKNSISLATYVNGNKYSTHYYGSNTRAGYFASGANNQNYTNLIKSDFLELKTASVIKFEVTNYNTNNFNVVNYVAISGQRSYRSVILFQRIK